MYNFFKVVATIKGDIEFDEVSRTFRIIINNNNFAFVYDPINNKLFDINFLTCNLNVKRPNQIRWKWKLFFVRCASASSQKQPLPLP